MNQSPFAVFSSYLLALIHLLAKQDCLRDYFTTTDMEDLSSAGNAMLREDLHCARQNDPAYMELPLSARETIECCMQGLQVPGIAAVALALGAEAHGGYILMRYTPQGEIVHFIAVAA